MSRLPKEWCCGRCPWLVLAASLLGCPEPSARAAVAINEIMYNPASGRASEEFIEIVNSGPDPANLTGWRFTKGVQFLFPALILKPGEFLVIAASTNVFDLTHPGVADVVGDWTGSLADSGEQLRLENASGQLVDELTYADEGDWSVRALLTNPGDSSSWTWISPHDGGGRTLERMNLRLPNSGQNWSASTVEGGTPGQPNSAATTQSAPLLSEASHFPLVPHSNDPILFSVRATDENSSGLTVTLFYRRHDTLVAPGFTSVTMTDVGGLNDPVPADGLWSARLPPQSNGTILEFYFEASDGEGNRRTWPAPGINESGAPGQFANALLQVDDSVYTGDQPVVRLIMTESERRKFAGVTNISRAEMNATMIVSDAVETECRYNVGLRLRGASSRISPVPNYRVNIPSDRRWKGVKNINLNAAYAHKQVMASVFSFKAGVPTARALSAQVRINGVNLANPGQAFAYNFSEFGSYALLEVLDSDWAKAHFPNDAGGNIYFARRPNALLAYLGEDWTAYRDIGYSKESNLSENDWGDLIRLTKILHEAPDDVYAAAVRDVLNVELVARFFAFNAAVGNGETTISTGEGDDYDLYRGVKDPRFILVPHDLDSTLGHGPTLPVDSDIFMAARNLIFRRFLQNPEFAPIYYRELVRMIDEVFAPESVQALFDQFVASYVPADVIGQMRNYLQARADFIRSQIPTRITVDAPLPQSEGFSRAEHSPISLSGFAPAITTRSVRVNGEPAAWLAWQARWERTNLVLNPGPNRLRVEAFDDEGRPVEAKTIDVWLAASSFTRIDAAELHGNVRWARAGSPYFLEGPLRVESDCQLTVGPGVAVLLGAQAGLDVRGTLSVEGSVNEPAWFIPAARSDAAWSGFAIQDSLGTNRIAHAVLDGASPNFPLLAITNSAVEIESVQFITSGPALRFENANLRVSNSDFPKTSSHATVSGAGWGAGGEIVFKGNRFGGASQANVLEFMDASGSESVLQISANEFQGGNRFGISLGRCRALIEGNSLTGFKREPGAINPASAISADGASEVWLSRNLVFANDVGLRVVNGSYAHAENNTFAANTEFAAVLGDANSNVRPGFGGEFKGEIFTGNHSQFGYALPVPGLTAPKIRVTYSLVQETEWPGDHNLTGDHVFLNSANNFRLRPGSPALGTGPNGLDMGAMVPAGAFIQGEPAAHTDSPNATLTIGGPGITHYRFRVNGGALSETEDPVSQPLVLSNLASGTYSVEVVGKNIAGVWQAENEATHSKSWTVDPDFPSIRINEVLAAPAPGGPFPEALELSNESSHSVDLSAMSLTDDPDTPLKFVFPSDVAIGPHEFLVILLDKETGAPGLHAGFALKQSGEGVWLFDAVSRGGRLLDSVQFGIQASNFSLGRDREGSWRLGAPTLGELNRSIALGDPQSLRISEWLTAGAQSDFVEIENPSPAPVALADVFLTDQPITWPDRHRIAPLSFIGPKAYLAFQADGQMEKGADHLNFKLPYEKGLLALMNADGQVIDSIIYGPQAPDISQGRMPMNPASIQSLARPTPGSFNVPRGSNGDTDGDGLPDVWEQAHGFDPLDPTDAALDRDQDGATNLEEFLRSTDPSKSDFILQAIPLSSEGTITGIRLRFHAEAGEEYLLDWTPQLANPRWLSMTNFPVYQQSGIVELETEVKERTGYFRVRIRRP